MTKVALALIGLTSLAGGLSGCKTQPAYAQVLVSNPIKEVSQIEAEECEDVSVLHRRAVKDKNRIGGTLAGALLGGTLGSTIGSGSTRTLAMVAGAGAAAYAGNQVQKGMQDSDTYTTTKRQCKKVMKPVEKIVGYDVKYLLDGALASVVLDRDPGPMLPLLDGKPITNGSLTAQK